MIEIHTISPPLILLASGHNDADANELYQVLVDHIRGRGGREEGCTGKGDERIVQGGGGRGKGGWGDGGRKEGGGGISLIPKLHARAWEHGFQSAQPHPPSLQGFQDYGHTLNHTKEEPRRILSFSSSSTNEEVKQ